MVIQIHKIIKYNNNNKINNSNINKLVIQKCYLMIILILKNKRYLKINKNNKKKINKIEINLIFLYSN